MFTEASPIVVPPSWTHVGQRTDKTTVNRFDVPACISDFASPSSIWIGGEHHTAWETIKHEPRGTSVTFRPRNKPWPSVVKFLGDQCVKNQTEKNRTRHPISAINHEHVPKVLLHVQEYEDGDIVVITSVQSPSVVQSSTPLSRMLCLSRTSSASVQVISSPTSPLRITAGYSSRLCVDQVKCCLRPIR